MAVQAPVKKNEKPLSWEYFDEPLLRVIKRGAVKPVMSAEEIGGFKPDNAQGGF